MIITRENVMSEAAKKCKYHHDKLAQEDAHQEIYDMVGTVLEGLGDLDLYWVGIFDIGPYISSRDVITSQKIVHALVSGLDLEAEKVFVGGSGDTPEWKWELKLSDERHITVTPASPGECIPQLHIHTYTSWTCEE